MVDLNRAVEHAFPRHHQPKCVTHPPGRRPAHSKDFGEPCRGQALIRLQQPHGLQPDTQGQLGRMQRGMGRHHELELAIAAGALIETRSRTPLAGIATIKRDRTHVTTGRANPTIRPHHAFQQPTAMLLIPKATIISLPERASIVSGILISFGSAQARS